MEDLIKKIKLLEKRHKKIVKDLNEAKNELENNCIHKETETIKDFYSGDYYNKTHVEYKTICTICGKILKTWKEYNDW